MRTIILIFLILSATLSFSQKKNIKVNVNLQIFSDTIKVALNSQDENLNTCSVQILDSLKKIVKTIPFPKAVGKQMMKQYTENSIPISDLARGNYTCLIYLGKEEMYKKAFYKDKK